MINGKLKNRKDTGFTLVELMAVVVIVAVVAGFALSVETPVSAYTTSGGRDIYSTAQEARMLAIDRGRNVLMESQGVGRVRVAVDENNDSLIDGNDTLVKEIELSPKVQLETAFERVAFNPRGFIQDGNGLATNLTVVVCKSVDNQCERGKQSSAYTRIEINQVGAISIHHGTFGN